jgi:REP element-mobilizing transposase RayT
MIFQENSTFYATISALLPKTIVRAFNCLPLWSTIMGHPLRCQKKTRIYSITNRTLHQKYFFLPSEEVNAIILGLLAKMADRYDIEIFAFVFMSNHFHLLARSQSLQMHLFMRDFQGQLARKLNRHWRRTGTFFERRYTATAVLDDDALTDKLRYTVCNPCESNLVRHPKMWPGLSSWSIHKSGEPLVGKVVNRKLYWSLKRMKEHVDASEQELIKMATEEFPLEMARLPQWDGIDDRAYRDRICDIIEEHAAHLAEQRRVRCLGVKRILEQSFNGRPKSPKKSPRPLCHTNCHETRQNFLEERLEVTERYKDAVRKIRKNKTQVSFPQGTIPPGHQCAVGG